MTLISEDTILHATIQFVKKELENAEGGHDWFHIERVYKNALLISEGEQVDRRVVFLGALLHDIADSKFHHGDENIGPKKARIFLQTLNISEEIIEHVVKIIENVSFKGGNKIQDFTSKELEVIQDADRLDAMGAIGIARTFNYGGFKNRKLYDPEIQPNLQMTSEEYKSSQDPTINHFYEKLLLLKDRMNTETGRKIAENRHDFMKLYLNQFYEEWEGRK